ncbi:hypothetical protein [Aliiroseovarius crassostreae]|uniref:hypothetical protein n=1 Tax=Aliiroseovarius crassostreae TaxID=154981 RepID=UPI003C7B9F42
MKRRDLIVATVAAAAAMPIPGSASTANTLTPVAMLFEEWSRNWDCTTSTPLTDEEGDKALEVISNLEKQILKEPCQCPEDFIRKVVALSAYGEWMLPDKREKPSIWAEAKAFI